MTTDRINRYVHRAPRYTSYPTAPHFSAGVTADDYQKWLAGLNTATPVSLYLHVSYCREMYWYCGYDTRATTRHRPIAEYH